MPLLNNMLREISCKIVYYGPALSGKTTNLQHIHAQVAPANRGELLVLDTMTDRTLFFDFLPLDVGEVEGWKLRFSLYTVPGQIEYAHNRKLILSGADGVIFVGDSDPIRKLDNLRSLEDMLSNMASYGLTPATTPIILQYNKRDLASALSVEELERDLNYLRVPSYESVATEGSGVFASLRAVSKLMINQLLSAVN